MNRAGGCGVRHLGDAFYTAAYSARPVPEARETRLLRSEDGLNWELVSTVTRSHMCGEADFWKRPDGSLAMLSRTGGSDPARLFTSDAAHTTWNDAELSKCCILAVAFWKDRAFVAGRGTARRQERHEALGTARQRPRRVARPAQWRRHRLSGPVDHSGIAGGGRAAPLASAGIPRSMSPPARRNRITARARMWARCASPPTGSSAAGRLRATMGDLQPEAGARRVACLMKTIRKRLSRP